MYRKMSLHDVSHILWYPSLSLFIMSYHDSVFRSRGCFITSFHHFVLSRCSLMSFHHDSVLASFHCFIIPLRRHSVVPSQHHVVALLGCGVVSWWRLSVTALFYCAVITSHHSVISSRHILPCIVLSRRSIMSFPHITSSCYSVMSFCHVNQVLPYVVNHSVMFFHHVSHVHPYIVLSQRSVTSFRHAIRSRHFVMSVMSFLHCSIMSLGCINCSVQSFHRVVPSCYNITSVTSLLTSSCHAVHSHHSVMLLCHGDPSPHSVTSVMSFCTLFRLSGPSFRRTVPSHHSITSVKSCHASFCHICC